MIETTASPKRGNKVVSFQIEDDLCRYHAGAVLDVEGVELVELWFQYNELQSIKRKALILSKDSSHGVSGLLNHTYGRSCPTTRRALATWSKACGARRGLERFLHREYATRRVEMRNRTLQSVLTAQHKMREEGIADPTYVALVLGKLSEAFSQDTRAFAHALGVADAFVNEAEDATRTKPKIVQRIKSPSSVMGIVTNSVLNSSSSHSSASQSVHSATSSKEGSQHRPNTFFINSSNSSSNLRNTCEMRHYY
jgi:hypothetical protein